jgi:WD40 repeat protein
MDDGRRAALPNYLSLVGACASIGLFGLAVAADQPQPLRQAGVDQHGDPLPDGAVARLGTTRWRLHESPVTFSPDGRYAIVPAGETTRLLDAVTGNTVRVLPIPSQSALFKGDNKTVMLAAGQKVRYVDVETGKTTRAVAVPDMTRTWSADGKRAVCMQQIDGGNWSYCVWDVDKGVELCRWAKWYGACALSHDGNLLAIRTRDEIGVFSVADKKPVSQWASEEVDAGRTGNARVVLFLPDGKTLAALEKGRVLLWDAATGKLKPKRKLCPSLTTAKDQPVTLAASADGRYLAAGGSNSTLYIWDLQADTLLHTLADAGKGLPIYTLDFTLDGKRLISQAHLFPSARVWDIARGKERSATAVASSTMEKIIFSPDGRTLATVGRWDPVQIWNAESGKLLYSFERGESFAFQRSGKALVLAGGQKAALWGLSDGTLRQQTKGAAASTPWAGAPDVGQISNWTCCAPDDDTIVAILSGDVRQVIPPRGRMPGATIYWTMVGIVDARTGKVQRSFRVRADHLSQFCMSPDGCMLAATGVRHGAQESSVFVWDLNRGFELFHIDLPASHGCGRLDFSADGRTLSFTSASYLVNQCEHTFHVIEIASGTARAECVQHWNPERERPCGAIASDQLAAVKKGSTLLLFDPLTGKEFGCLRANLDRITHFAFSADGQRLACTGDDATALIWDIRKLLPAPVKTRPTDDECARLWDELSSSDAKAACRAAGQLIQSPEEAVAYLGKKLQPALPIPAGKIAGLLAQLDSDRFDRREQAGRELLQLPELAEPALLEAAKKQPSLELSRRIEALLARIQERRAKGPWTLAGEPLRAWRAVEVLERIGTPDAARLLERLAGGAPHAVLTSQSTLAAKRLGKRAGKH